MDRDAIRVSRATLYEQVWSVPMCRLARDYGISDVGLSKICTRLGVPVPGRGYWEKLKHGKAEPVPPLPDLPPGRGVDLVVQRPARVQLPEPAASEAQGLIGREADPQNAISVQSRLNQPHPLVALARNSLQGASRNEKSLLMPKSARSPDIRVSPKQLPRALRVFDALLKALEDRGFQISVNQEEKNRTEVLVLGERLELRLEELLTRTESRRTSPWGSTYRDYKHVPNGRLCLRILGVEWTGLRQRWQDGKRQQLEMQLNDFFVGLIKAAVHQKAGELERGRERQQRKALERERLREQERRRLIQVRNQALDERLLAWRRSREIRAYLAVLNTENASATSTHEKTWLQWLFGHAQELENIWHSAPDFEQVDCNQCVTLIPWREGKARRVSGPRSVNP